MQSNGHGNDGQVDVETTRDSATEGDDAEVDADTGPHLVGHVHLKVRDLERSIAFYTDVLDLAVVERHGNFAFLSWGDRHHDVALQEVSENAEGPGPGVGLYHAAIEVPAPEGLKDVYERLQERDVDVSPVDHGISQAIYFDDPDGNGLEVYRDTRAHRDQWRWAGTNEPFDPMSL
jgi:catechol 2,3-dioxygenase